MADKKGGKAAAPATSGGVDFASLNAHYQTSLAIREDMRISLEQRVTGAESRAAAAEAALADSETGARDAAAEAGRRAREREEILNSEKAALAAEVARLKGLVYEMEVTAAQTRLETEATLRARDSVIASLRSRLDDITAEFMEKLQLLVGRMQERVELIVPAGEEDSGRGLKVKDSSKLLLVLQNAASIDLPKGGR
jgi:hypothetical protein